MRGIILAGGTGSRLAPLTQVVSKQLMPIYDKPMIYYPLSTLMLAGITEILIISTPKDQKLFENLFLDGKQLGLSIAYRTQASPQGIAQAFLIGEEFIGNDSVALILGDNFFYGPGLSDKFERLTKQNHSTIFAYAVKNPSDYGVIEFDDSNKAKAITEKPKNPKSAFAIPGLYFYDNDVVQIAKSLKPSARNELEITDINNSYLNQGKLHIEILPRGTAWFDMGTYDSLLDASSFVRTVELRQGLKIGAIEEIAWRQGYITKDQFIELAKRQLSSLYGNYLLEISANKHYL